MKKLYEAQIADLSEEEIAKIAGGISDEAITALATAGGSAAGASITMIITFAAFG